MKTESIDIADAMATGVLMLTQSLDIKYMNASAEILFGSSRKRMQGKPYQRLLKEDILGWVLEKAVSTREIQSLRELHFTTSHDGAVIADIVVSPIVAGGELESVLVELYRIDQQLRITQEETLLSQLQTTQSLVRGMAHEIKNPLGGLRGAAQLLETELPSPELREYTSIIISEADRLQVLVDRMSGSQSPTIQEDINIHEVLERVRKLVSVDIPAKVNIRFDYDPSIPEMRADKDKLIQIVLNMVVNALKAVGSEGEVVFKTRVVRRFMMNQKIHRLVLKLQIIDNGVGIPDEIKDKVFFPMVSGSADGTGLGLSIAQSLANAHDGLIEFQSTPGDTCFTLLLPIQAQE